MSENECGVRWREVNRRNEVVVKEKIFQSRKARDKFIDKLPERDGFVEFLAHFN